MASDPGSGQTARLKRWLLWGGAGAALLGGLWVVIHFTGPAPRGQRGGPTVGEAGTAVCRGVVRAVADPWAALSPDAVMTSRRCTFGAAWSTRWRVVSGGSCGGREPP